MRVAVGVGLWRARRVLHGEGGAVVVAVVVRRRWRHGAFPPGCQLNALKKTRDVLGLYANNN